MLKSCQKKKKIIKDCLTNFFFFFKFIYCVLYLRANIDIPFIIFKVKH